MSQCLQSELPGGAVLSPMDEEHSPSVSPHVDENGWSSQAPTKSYRDRKKENSAYSIIAVFCTFWCICMCLHVCA